MHISFIADVSDESLARRAIYTICMLSHMAGCRTQPVSPKAELPRDGAFIWYGSRHTVLHETRPQLMIPCASYLSHTSLAPAGPSSRISGTIIYEGYELPIWFPHFSPDGPVTLLRYGDGSPAAVRRRNTIKLGFDLLMSAFFLLSCQEEYWDRRRDKFGRFLAAYSCRADAGRLTLPVVNWLSRILFELLPDTGICDAASGGFPRSRVCLSHDVDNVSKRNLWVLGSRAGHLIQATAAGDTRRMRHHWSQMRDSLRVENAYWNFQTYRNEEVDAGCRSTFYFQAGRSRGRFGARYRVESLAGTIRQLHRGHWEVGLHAGFQAWDYEERLKEERRKLASYLGEEPEGCRTHYLRFAVPETWKVLSRVGFMYDSSLGYSDRPGFRAGIAGPFFPFDLERDCVLPLVELPLVLMDTHFLRRRNDDPERWWEELKQLMVMVDRCGGTLMLLWHQRSLDAREFPGLSRMYRRILDLIRERGMQVLRARDVAARFLDESAAYARYLPQ